jgi:hypothetical protein
LTVPLFAPQQVSNESFNAKIENVLGYDLGCDCKLVAESKQERFYNAEIVCAETAISSIEHASKSEIE